jgi:serine carboxypeptidase-like clade 1
VASLPLLKAPLPSAHYSGYLAGANGSHLHYYFVEATEVDAATAPTVWWTNGGPGCSSMDGWGYELGPLHFKNYAAGGPTLELNPHTWAKLANVIFVENPPGVGFSWRDDGNYNTSDSLNAADNFAALGSFFDKFPEYKANPLYLAGESYAGIYVPTLAAQVLAHGGYPSFAGILVGNGVTSAKYDDSFLYSDAEFAVGHGLMTQETYASVQANCSGDKAQSPACFALQAEFYQQTAHINPYGCYYKCFVLPQHSWLHVPALRRRVAALAWKRGLAPKDYITAVQAEALTLPPGATVPPGPKGVAAIPCIDSVSMTTYLNRADVKAALHVEPSLSWAICAEINYTSDIPDVVDVYATLIAASKKVLVYNGNTDMAVPYTGTRHWIKAAGFKATRKFAAWNYATKAFPYGEQTAGWAVQYEQHMWFAEVNGAGHMVPQFEPAVAFDMFRRFITGAGF